LGITLQLEDYPSLYKESSICARKNQEKHFGLFQARIILLLAYAALGAITWSKIPLISQLPPDLKSVPLLIIAISLAIALVVAAVLETKKYDRLWFSTRAIAESVKKETWLFVTKTKPYDETVSDTEAKKRFLAFLKNILKTHPNTCSILTMNSEEGRQITGRMEEVRRGSVAERLDFYIKNRIHDQQTWYAKKAKLNISKESKWNITMWILQALAVIFAIANIFFLDSSINLIGVATTSGTAVLSWINSKNYRDLSQSYGLIAQELSILEDQAKEVTTEKELSDLVADVEGSMAQEQIIWKTKRLKNLTPE
jgi:hypothetical protein